MKRGAILLAGLIVLSGLAGCAGSWSASPPTVTVTTTVFTSSPEPPLVCHAPTDDQLDGYLLPGGANQPTADQMVVVDIGVDSISGTTWQVIAVDTAALGSYYNNSDNPVDVSVVMDSPDANIGQHWYAVNGYVPGSLQLVPLTGENLARAYAAVLKAVNCLGYSVPTS